MSTFDGLIEEFPDIRIDYFRNHLNRTPPAACFLSHVHSDHLLGLDTLKMPFVYCSAVTQRILLRMEKYPHRINFSKGILEARKKTYKHLKSVLRPLPLQTPFDLELRPNVHIRVTLFDANHCPGSVMFLIEGDNRAILYTGDVRAEPWWVNSIARSPVIVPYTSGHKRLNCLYLDTTFASHHDIYKEFPAKAEGLAELLNKLSDFPVDSIFYFRAWTLGYEDVWVAMSNFLRSRVHVDRYQLQIFRGAADDHITSDSVAALAGFRVGNAEQSGYLTTDSATKIHSCEPGLPCHSAISKHKNVVWITPIISRTSSGAEIAEVGAGGGKGDLYQRRELDIGSDTMLEALRLLVNTLADSKEAATKLDDLIQSARSGQDHRVMFDSLGTDPASEISLKEFVKLLVDDKSISTTSDEPRPKIAPAQGENTLRFPYSRHSSYSELCDLVQRFQPEEICPCTVDLASWTDGVSMESLFGKFCPGSSFRYDERNRREAQQRHQNDVSAVDGDPSQQYETQRTELETQTASQNSVYIFTSVEEQMLTEQDITDEQPEIPSPSIREDDLQKFRNAWEDVNGGASKYENKSRADLMVDKSTISSQSIESVRRTEENVNDTVESLGPTCSSTSSGEDLADVIGRPFEVGKRIRISGDDTVSDVDSADGLNASRPHESCSTINLERRKEAFEAARACLTSGDHSRWNALNICSLSQFHEDSSQEL